MLSPFSLSLSSFFFFFLPISRSLYAGKPGILWEGEEGKAGPLQGEFKRGYLFFGGITGPAVVQSGGICAMEQEASDAETTSENRRRRRRRRSYF